METCVHLWLYLAEFLWELEKRQTWVVEKIKTHFMFRNFFFFSKIVLFMRWCGKNTIEQGGIADKDIIRHMRTAWWILIATNTHSEYDILIVFHCYIGCMNRASVLPYTCIACHVSTVQDAGKTGLKYAFKSTTKTLWAVFVTCCCTEIAFTVFSGR
jgi:hypothetical protein